MFCAIFNFQTHSSARFGSKFLLPFFAGEQMPIHIPHSIYTFLLYAGSYFTLFFLF